MSTLTIQRILQKRVAFSTQTFEALAVVLLITGAFLVRVVGQTAHVFVGDEVWYRGVDAWYHMRLADMVAASFTNFPSFDSYALYPVGREVGYMPMLSWLTAGLGKIVGHEIAGAYMPPVLGALTIIPVYFLGKELLNGRVGLIAALLVAAMPGEFLHRTLLGFTDHHALEALLVPTTILLFIKAARHESWEWAIAAGLFLGAYQLSWAGASLLLIVLGLWVVVEFSRRVYKGESIAPLLKTVSLPVGTSLLVSAAFTNNESRIIAFGMAVTPVILWLLSKVTRDRWQAVAGLALFIGAGLTLGSFYVSWMDLILTLFWRGSATVQEMGALTIPQVFQIYGLAILLAVAGLWLLPRHRNMSLLALWAGLLIVMGLSQKRWGYYATVPISLLAAYTSIYATKFVNPTVRVLIVAIIISFLLLPNSKSTTRIATLPNNISPSWHAALTWLKENSPPPFESEDAYYQPNLNQRPEYGVLSWWDYGHWIIRVAKRVPTDSPTHVTGLDARFLSAKSNEQAREEIAPVNIRYVILDPTLVSTKWYAIARRSKSVGMPVEQSQAWRVWNMQSPDWRPVFQTGDVRIFERAY